MKDVSSETMSFLSRQPLYLQLQKRLMEKIKNGDWNPGDKIPSENVIAEQNGVSIGTVRKALQLLISTGILVSRQGSGTYVRTIRSQGYNNPFIPFASLDGKPRFHHQKIILFETISVPENLYFCLGVSPQTKVFHIIRHIYRVDNQKEKLVNIDELFLLPEYFPELSERKFSTKFQSTDSLYKFFDREFGVVITNEKCNLTYEELDDETTKYLQAPEKMKIIKFTRVSMAFGRTPVGYRVSWLDVHNLQITFDLASS